MKPLHSTFDLEGYRRIVADALQSPESLIFLDTNVLAWSFRLNNLACGEFISWLDTLKEDERLLLPAWTIHEYNHHLLRDDQAFFSPHKSTGKQLASGLDELARVASLMTGDGSASELGFPSREHLLKALDEASNTIRRCVVHFAKHDAERRERLIASLERIMSKAAMKSDVQKLAAEAADEAAARYSSRLSPGFQDAGKEQNATGDLIIWKEILDCCMSRKAKAAVLVTNDRKPDWVYTPLSIVLPNGKTVHGSSEKAQSVKLPKPDLIAEFSARTGSDQFHVVSMATVIDALSSETLSRHAHEFRHLAIAIQVDLARTPSEAVVQWFLKNRDEYKEALYGVCNWNGTPSEVNLEEFRAWTVERMKDLDADSVQWENVFCELFL